MKRIFCESRAYDYSTRKEAERHIEEMKSKGWEVKRINNQGIRYYKGCYLPYSVHYQRY